MAAINSGKLPTIGDEVVKMEIEADGTRIHFKSGATIYGHYYNSSRHLVVEIPVNDGSVPANYPTEIDGSWIPESCVTPKEQRGFAQQKGFIKG